MVRRDPGPGCAVWPSACYVARPRRAKRPARPRREHPVRCDHARRLTRYTLRAQPDRSSASGERADSALQLSRCARAAVAASCCGSRTRTPPATNRHSSLACSMTCAWLGLDWGEGPDRGGPHGPYLQSERGAVYAAAIETLRVGRPGLSLLLHTGGAEPRAARAARGGSSTTLRRDLRLALPTTRFAAGMGEGRPARSASGCPAGRTIAFDDRIHGPQRFASDDIGDFVVARADGSSSFFLSNAVDDARMGSTSCCVATTTSPIRRGSCCCSRHSSFRHPAYGHLPLLLAPSGGAPLEARRGRGLERSAGPGLPARGHHQLSAAARSCGRTGPLAQTRCDAGAFPPRGREPVGSALRRDAVAALAARGGRHASAPRDHRLAGRPARTASATTSAASASSVRCAATFCFRTMPMR